MIKEDIENNLKTSLDVIFLEVIHKFGAGLLGKDVGTTMIEILKIGE